MKYLSSISNCEIQGPVILWLFDAVYHIRFLLIGKSRLKYLNPVLKLVVDCFTFAEKTN